MANSKKPPVGAPKPAASTPAHVGSPKAEAPAPAPAVKPVEAKTEVKASAPKSVEAKPIETKPVEAKLAETKAPAAATQPKPVEVKVADTKPVPPPAPVAPKPAPVVAAEAPKPAPAVEVKPAPKPAAAPAAAMAAKPAPAAPKAPAVAKPTVTAPKAEKPAQPKANVAASLDVLKPVTVMQENVRASTEKAITVFRGQYAEVKTIAETATSQLEDSMKAAQEGSRALSFKLFEIAKAQTQAHLDHAKALAATKTLPELLNAQQSFLVAQIEMAQTRGKDVAALAGKVANDVTAPLRASLNLLLRR